MKYLETIIPHIPSKDINQAIRFMVDVLGCKSSSHSEFYAELHSSEQTIGILAAQGKPNEQSLYLRVSDIDLLWRDIENKLSNVKTKAL